MFWKHEKLKALISLSDVKSVEKADRVRISLMDAERNAHFGFVMSCGASILYLPSEIGSPCFVMFGNTATGSQRIMK